MPGGLDQTPHLPGRIYLLIESPLLFTSVSSGLHTIVTNDR